MKTELIKLFVIGLFFLFTGCTTSSFKGTYECADCLYTQLSFSQDGTVEILAGGIKAKGDFEVEEDKLTIITETSEYVFTIKDDKTLEGQDDVKGTYTKAMN